MEYDFFKQPILNSPYEYPSLHWKLDTTGQPTNEVLDKRRPAKYVTPIPRSKKQQQQELDLRDAEGYSTKDEKLDPTPIINRLRTLVDEWRRIPNPSQWKVTPITQRLLQHWRHHNFTDIRPFFCQVEAVETLIWLTEVAPKSGVVGQQFRGHLEASNEAANPELFRLALKMATGAGKTTVMAMVIAWQTLNACRFQSSDRFTTGFLIVTPGITIKDRLRVLLPNDPDSYYQRRQLVPQDLLPQMQRANVVITNYHAFKLRETMDLARGNRALLQGRGEQLQTLESEGKMLQRVMPSLMGMRHILAINDEAHHCYREKPGDPDEPDYKGDERDEAEKNKEAARLWISGLEAVNRLIGIHRVVDLSATPFFLRGSGYREGVLFPWTMSDFSLMDAIECGIVKLPRVPVADNIPGEDVPVFRNLWEHVRKDMPKKGRGKNNQVDPLKLPLKLKNALDALYGQYIQTWQQWEEQDMGIPPCFIVVCNNTATSKLVYDYISGFYREDDNDPETLIPGHLELFRNFDENNQPYPRPRTLLIDSTQLESGDALDANFRAAASDEIERFRREIIQREGPQAADAISDQELLREVMNTVGKKDRLGETVRCVVSVSMLTEGWDANNVTHILGVRAFGTQLLCEQVIGRALRRQSYDLNEEDRFNVEYADVLGIPFDFNAKPVVAKPIPPRPTIQVRAISPERDHLEIRFPRVQGYRIELPPDNLTATFTDDTILELTPELIGPSKTRVEGIIGEGIDLNLVHTGEIRTSTILFHLTQYIIQEKFRDANEEPKLHLFGEVKRIARRWMKECLLCKGDTYPAQLLWTQIADMAAEKISQAISYDMRDSHPIKAIIDPFNPEGSSRHVNFTTSRTDRWQTSHQRCQLNWVILDSGWEGEFCRVAEAHPRVKAYVKNHNLGLEIPYTYQGGTRQYLPDFILLIDDGRPDPLHLIVEIKGYRREDAKLKKSTMDSNWVPGVNYLQHYGRWAFAEFTDVWEMETDFAAVVEQQFNQMIAETVETVAPLTGTQTVS